MPMLARRGGVIVKADTREGRTIICGRWLGGGVGGGGARGRSRVARACVVELDAREGTRCRRADAALGCVLARVQAADECIELGQALGCAAARHCLAAVTPAPHPRRRALGIGQVVCKRGRGEGLLERGQQRIGQVFMLLARAHCAHGPLDGRGLLLLIAALGLAPPLTPPVLAPDLHTRVRVAYGWEAVRHAPGAVAVHRTHHIQAGRGPGSQLPWPEAHAREGCARLPAAPHIRCADDALEHERLGLLVLGGHVLRKRALHSTGRQSAFVPRWPQRLVLRFGRGGDRRGGDRRGGGRRGVV
mmetsp:Transcript_7949/g.20013  ORF Transcript_7949/g.20013 Transcript_7949/m.20013 type:complete len:303 (-) Transcript_7949:511-1419(-)